MELHIVSACAKLALRALAASGFIMALSSLCAPVWGHHFRYTAYLSGAAEAMPNDSLGAGHAVITVDLDLATIEIDATFAGLVGTVTEAHINAPTAAVGTGTAIAATPVPAFEGFPSGVTAGEYEQEYSLGLAATYNPAFIAASGGTVGDAYNELALSLDEGKAYFDIATSAFPSGEIRGFLSYVPGDFNNNGVADTADYVVWRGSLGDVGEGLVADANNDDVITEDDYAFWRENFGRAGLSSGGGSALVDGGSAPEPPAMAMLAIVCVAFVGIRAKRPKLLRSGESYFFS